MWFKKQKGKNEKVQMSKEDFGRVVLAYMLVQNADNQIKQFDEMAIKVTYMNYLVYISYLLFLSRKILEQRFSKNDARIIVSSAVSGLFEYMDEIPKEKKPEGIRLFKELHTENDSYLEDACADLGSEQGLKDLTSSFLRDCGAEKGFYNHLSAFTMFSGFIIHHTNDILNDKIILT